MLGDRTEDDEVLKAPKQGMSFNVRIISDPP